MRKTDDFDVFGGWEFNAGIEFLEFRASEVAAAVAIVVTGETQTIDFEAATSVLIEHVEKVYIIGSLRIKKWDIHDDFAFALVNFS